jgi:hypothetical protein
MRIGETESSLKSLRVVPSDAYGAEESRPETIAATIHQDLRSLRLLFFNCCTLPGSPQAWIGPKGQTKWRRVVKPCAFEGGFEESRQKAEAMSSSACKSRTSPLQSS